MGVLLVIDGRRRRCSMTKRLDSKVGIAPASSWPVRIRAVRTAANTPELLHLIRLAVRPRPCSGMGSNACLGWTLLLTLKLGDMVRTTVYY
jgi:hypothetical protein